MNRFKEFSELMIQWDEETGFHSSSKAWESHPNFKKLLDFEDAIPFACLFLEDDCHRSWSILYRLVPEKNLPNIPKEYCGRVPIMKEIWKYWALNKKYVTIKYNPQAYWVEDKYGNRGDWH